MWKTHTKHLILAACVLAAASTHVVAQEAELIAVLKSDADIEAKSTACRELSRIATKQSVPTLASLLGDEKLSHMARYALEPIRDPSVDDALRDALGKVQGRTRLGVIGSLGVRRDTKAVAPLAKLLKDADAKQAAARALGSIGNAEAAKALEDALSGATGQDQLNICEGLLRCAEALAADGKADASKGIYDRLRKLSDAPPQVRTAALRGAVLARGADGVQLLVEAVRGADYVLAAAAARTAMESSAPEIADALVAELPKLPAERQGLVMLALANRGDSRIQPTVLKAAQSDDDQLRILAFRALKRVGDASCVPALLEAATTGSDETANAALETLENLQDESVDKQIVERLANADGKLRLMLIDLATRRRTAAAAPALWKAADDADSSVRTAALAGLGVVVDADGLPKLIAKLGKTQSDQEAKALDKAIQDVGSHSADPEAAAAKIAAALPKADAAVQDRILETLNVIGGATALKTVADAAQAKDVKLQDAASRVLGRWKSVDAAPVLLDLCKATDEQRLQIRAIRAYIRIARQFDMADGDRAEMCRTALKMATRDEDKRLVLEILLRYPNEEMLAIAYEMAENPALKEQAMLVVMGIASKGIDRGELGRALAQAGQKPVQLEIVKAVYGAGDKVKDVTETLRKYAKNYRIIFLPDSNYNKSFGGDPASGVVKKLDVQYRINGKDGQATFGENATIVLPMPK